MWNDFNNTVQTDGGFMNDSQINQTEDKSELKRGQNVVSLMIGHIIRNNEDLLLWGNPIRIICIVGIVRKIEQVTTKITYELEDETGTIKAINWLEADKLVSESGVKLNSYARVYGFMRENNYLRHILVVRILPVTQLAEITNHLLEVTCTMLHASRMANQVLSNDSMQMQTSTVMTNSADDNRGMTKEQTIVFNFIQTEAHTDSGVERNAIKARVPKPIANKVDEIIDFLLSEGHIYTTSTDDHFKAT